VNEEHVLALSAFVPMILGASFLSQSFRAPLALLNGVERFTCTQGQQKRLLSNYSRPVRVHPRAH
jgi:hypothetical protein